MIEEYKVGTIAFLERFAGLTILDGLTKSLHRGKYTGYRIPWDKLDLSDPEHPRLLGHKDDLKRIDPQEEKSEGKG